MARQPLLRLRVAHRPPGLNVIEPLLDLLADVNVVLNVLERRVLGQALQDLQAPAPSPSPPPYSSSSSSAPAALYFFVLL
jgi:hypothetical protein